MHIRMLVSPVRNPDEESRYSRRYSFPDKDSIQKYEIAPSVKHILYAVNFKNCPLPPRVIPACLLFETTDQLEMK